MKKLIYLILLLPIICFAQSKPLYQRTPDGPNIIGDANLKVNKYLIVPISSVSGIVGGSIDSAGYLRYNPSTKTYQGYYGNTKGWADISPLNTYSSNYVNKTAVPIGSLQPLDTLHSAGKTPEQVTSIIFTQTIHPAYNIPTAGESGSPGAGYYERGYNFSNSGSFQHGPITLSSSYTQNDGGSLISTVYKNGSTVITSPYSLTLNANTTLTVYKTYNTGVCKNNNLGVLDCIVGSGNAPNPAPVAGGTATASMGYNIYDKGYAGWATSGLSGGLPIQADILAANTQDNSGGGSINTQNQAQQGSDKRYFFITTSIRSHVSVNGTPSDAAFTFNQPITFTNASGGTFTGYAQVSNFDIGSTGAITFVFN